MVPTRKEEKSRVSVPVITFFLELFILKVYFEGLGVGREGGRATPEELVPGWNQAFHTQTLSNGMAHCVLR